MAWQDMKNNQNKKKEKEFLHLVLYWRSTKRNDGMG